MFQIYRSVRNTILSFARLLIVYQHGYVSHNVCDVITILKKPFRIWLMLGNIRHHFSLWFLPHWEQFIKVSVCNCVFCFSVKMCLIVIKFLLLSKRIIVFFSCLLFSTMFWNKYKLRFTCTSWLSKTFFFKWSKYAFGGVSIHLLSVHLSLELHMQPLYKYNTQEFEITNDP